MSVSLVLFLSGYLCYALPAIQGRVVMGWIERELERYDREIVEALSNPFLS